jgi:hypothetical protein
MRIERTPGHPGPARFANRNLESRIMQKTALGLSALLLMAATTTPALAQDVATPAHSAGCVEYFGCLKYGTLTPAQARTCRGHPEFVEVQSAAAPTAPDARKASPIEQAASAPIAPRAAF